jgi:hypothetical protein
MAESERPVEEPKVVDVGLQRAVGVALEAANRLHLEDGDLLVLPVDMARDPVEGMVRVAGELSALLRAQFGIRVCIALLPTVDELRRYGRMEGIEYLERCLAELQAG